MLFSQSLIDKVNDAGYDNSIDEGDKTVTEK